MQVFINIVILASTVLGLNVTLDFYVDVVPPAGARPTLAVVYMPPSGFLCGQPNAITLQAQGGGPGLVIRNDETLILYNVCMSQWRA